MPETISSEDTAQEEALPNIEVDESMQQQEEVEEVEQKVDNTAMEEASYYNNMKVSLKYKMLRWLQRAREKLYNLNLR